MTQDAKMPTGSSHCAGGHFFTYMTWDLVGMMMAAAI